MSGLIANYAEQGRAVATANRAGRAQSYSAILKSAMDHCAVTQGKHLIELAVELAYRHKDILKAILAKIIPEATSGESASMRRIILLCPDKSGKVSEVISYDTQPIVRPVLSTTIDGSSSDNNEYVTELCTDVDNSIDVGGGMPCPDPRDISGLSNITPAPISVSNPSQSESPVVSLETNVETTPSEILCQVIPDEYGNDRGLEEMPSVY